MLHFLKILRTTFVIIIFKLSKTYNDAINNFEREIHQIKECVNDFSNKIISNYKTNSSKPLRYSAITHKANKMLKAENHVIFIVNATNNYSNKNVKQN